MRAPAKDLQGPIGAAGSREPATGMERPFEFILDGRRFRTDLAQPIDLSRPIRFDSDDPALFGAGPPRAAPLLVGDFIADIRRGGSVNADRLDLVPHAHGTHTETAGHLALSRMPICDLALTGPLPATLATVQTASNPRARDEAGEAFAEGDQVVTAEALGLVLGGADPAFLGGLVLWISVVGEAADRRVQPTGAAADGWHPARGRPVYLTGAAAGLLAAAGVRHLVLELPSIDRPEDGGRLAAHRAFWEFDASETEPSAARRHATITELARIPEGLPDGRYLLDLHLPNLGTDAVPSRPVLYAVTPFPESP